MNEPFDLPVLYKDKEIAFPAQLQQTRYAYRFAVDVYGQEIFFEPDEERNYRAMIDPEQLEGNKITDIELLQAIAITIEAVVR
jgi:hypothetical protein